jgi:7-carboxy-7-deazaguanine synthase (Cx14CxxC type)
MTYTVKEIYYTLQGEGAYSGRPVVFCRFTGCNLWTGREEDRARAVCQFCDTDFIGTNGPRGGVYPSAEHLARAIDNCWPSRTGEDYTGQKMVVCTGGEPLLQLDSDFVEALHALSFTIAIETNGTQAPPAGIDWICVSPKANAPLVLTTGDELKLIYPQIGVDPNQFTTLAFRRFFLQPMDGPSLEENTQLAVRYCLEHPRWELSLQTHKIIGLP